MYEKLESHFLHRLCDQIGYDFNCAVWEDEAMRAAGDPSGLFGGDRGVYRVVYDLEHPEMRGIQDNQPTIFAEFLKVGKYLGAEEATQMIDDVSFGCRFASGSKEM